MRYNHRFLFVEAKSHMLRAFQQFFQLPQIVELKGGIVSHYTFQRDEKNRFRASLEFEASEPAYQKICEFMTKQGFRFTTPEAVKPRLYHKDILWYDNAVQQKQEVLLPLHEIPSREATPLDPDLMNLPADADMWDNEDLPAETG